MPGIFLEDFSEHVFPTKNEKKSVTKSAKKSGTPKMKICKKSVLPKTDPKFLGRSFTGFFRNENVEFTESLLCSLVTI